MGKTVAFQNICFPIWKRCGWLIVTVSAWHLRILNGKKTSFGASDIGSGTKHSWNQKGNYWKGKNRKRWKETQMEISHQLVHSPVPAVAGAGRDWVRSPESLQVLPAGSLTSCLPECVLAGSWNLQQNWAWTQAFWYETQTPPSSVFLTVPNAYPRSGFKSQLYGLLSSTEQVTWCLQVLVLSSVKWD